MKTRVLIFLSVFLLSAGGFFSSPTYAQTPTIKTTAPKRANIFLAWRLTPEEAADLARWDLLILDAEVGAKQPELIRAIRAKNPQTIILAYMSTQEIRKDADKMPDYAPTRAALAARVSDSWYLTRANGERVSFWPTAWMINITSDWKTVLPQFIHDQILSTGLWDGIMFDNSWDNVTGYVGSVAGADDAAWRAATHELFSNLRALNPEAILLGNGSAIYTELNGVLFESFPRAGWSTTLANAKKITDTGRPPAFALINSNADNIENPNDWQTMRYGLTSALLTNSYYSFDFGDQRHESRWWYDEYNAALGRSIGDPKNIDNLKNSFMGAGVWRRDFANGSVFVNNSGAARALPLNTDFETLRGTQDSNQNSGRLVSEIDLDAHDGIILLKPLDKLRTATYINGSFVRVMDEHGATKRNGFFSYTPEINGGAAVIPVTLDSTGQPTKIAVATKTSVRVIAVGSGAVLWEQKPLGKKYSNDFSLTALFKNGRADKIAVATRGTRPQIFIFNIASGAKEKTIPLTRFGTNPTLTHADTDNDGADEIIIGSGAGVTPGLTILRPDGLRLATIKISTRLRTGLIVSAGFFNSSAPQILVFDRNTKQPKIQFFTRTGKTLIKNKSVTLAPLRARPEEINIATEDVDGDGVSEILFEYKNVFATAALTPRPEQTTLVAAGQPPK